MNTKEYNGYTNYETWLVALWINNDEGLQDYVMEMAARSDGYAYHLADDMKAYFEDDKPELSGMWADMLGAALSEVDWDDLGETFMRDYEEEHKDEEEEDEDD